MEKLIQKWMMMTMKILMMKHMKEMIYPDEDDDDSDNIAIFEQGSYNRFG